MTVQMSVARGFYAPPVADPGGGGTGARPSKFWSTVVVVCIRMLQNKDEIAWENLWSPRASLDPAWSKWLRAWNVGCVHIIFCAPSILTILDPPLPHNVFHETCMYLTLNTTRLFKTNKSSCWHSAYPTVPAKSLKTPSSSNVRDIHPLHPHPPGDLRPSTSRVISWTISRFRWTSTAWPGTIWPSLVGERGSVSFPLSSSSGNHFTPYISSIHNPHLERIYHTQNASSCEVKCFGDHLETSTFNNFLIFVKFW